MKEVFCSCIGNALVACIYRCIFYTHGAATEKQSQIQYAGVLSLLSEAPNEPARNVDTLPKLSSDVTHLILHYQPR